MDLAWILEGGETVLRSFKKYIVGEFGQMLQKLGAQDPINNNTPKHPIAKPHIVILGWKWGV